MILCRPPKVALVRIVSYRGSSKVCPRDSLTVAGFGESRTFLALLGGTRINFIDKLRIVYVDFIGVDSNDRTFVQLISKFR